MPAVIFVGLVMPIWLVLHYRQKSKDQSGLSSSDRADLEEMAKRILEERAARNKPAKEVGAPVPSRIAKVAEEIAPPSPGEAVEHEVGEVSKDVKPEEDNLDEFERRLNRLGR